MRDKSSKRPKSGFDRREFLRGSGAAAAATALHAGGGLARGQEGGVKIEGREAKMIRLTVNGADHSVMAEPRTTLMEALRQQLHLTGVKPVDTEGNCGGSTVLIDGKPASAANTLAIECTGKEIQTAESLGGKKPDAVVTAFVNHDAMQCGFCTPGFVVAVKAFLDKNPKATEEQIRGGLNGNLCRCGTYANVIQAAMEVVKGS